MNASDIIKAKQRRTLYQAYYRPTIFPGLEGSNSTLINSSINYCPISTITINGDIISSVVSCVTLHYSYKCDTPNISYNLLNDINQGKYLCGFPYCSTIVQWNNQQEYITGVCDCKISFLTWKNTSMSYIYSYSTINYSTIETYSSLVPSGPHPLICPLVSFNQGTSFDNNCSNCNLALYNNTCCENCTST
jgi:hypothetical protein